MQTNQTGTAATLANVAAGHVEETREFANRDDAWAFMHQCDETNGAIVAGYPSLTAPYTVRYYRREGK